MLGSTAGVSARDNTGTNYTSSNKGVPIYWVKGDKVADDYEDLYDGDWDDEADPKTQSGGGSAFPSIWTGSNADGTAATPGYLGDSVNTVATGSLNSTLEATSPLGGGGFFNPEFDFSMYGLSPVFEIANPPIEIGSLTATATDAHGLAVRWHAYPYAVEYELEMRKLGETDWVDLDYTDYGPLPSESAYPLLGIATDLECDTGYDFQVRARGDGGRDFGPHTRLRTWTGPCADEFKVTNLKALIYPDCARLTWIEPTSDLITGYRLLRLTKPGGANSGSPVEVDVLEEIHSGASYSDCAAGYGEDGNDYAYAVFPREFTGINADGNLTYKDYTATQTPAQTYGPHRPNEPRNLQFTQSSLNSRSIQWHAAPPHKLMAELAFRGQSYAGSASVVGNPSALGWWTTETYRIERQKYERRGGQMFLDGDWEEVGAVDLTNTGRGVFVDSGPPPSNKLYRYRVIAVNTLGEESSGYGEWLQMDPHGGL